MTWAILLWSFLPQLTAVSAGEAILKRVEAALASVHDYTVSLDIAADLDEARIPPMKATMYFKEPDRVHFASEGFALLPREAFSLNPARLLERFRVDSVVSESSAGRKDYRLHLKAREERTRLRDVWLRISSEHWTIDEGDMSFDDGRVVTIRFRHEPVGTVWLPAELFLSISQPGGVKADPSSPDDRKPVPLGRSMPRQGSVTVRFSGYRLNTGLSDELFTQPPGATVR